MTHPTISPLGDAANPLGQLRHGVASAMISILPREASSIRPSTSLEKSLIFKTVPSPGASNLPQNVVRESEGLREAEMRKGGVQISLAKIALRSVQPMIRYYRKT